MRLRREQGLFAIVLLIGVVVIADSEPTPKPRRLRVTKREYVPQPIPGDPLADVSGDPVVGGGRDPFVEPSETSPLPPRQMPFPPLSELSVVAPPMLFGQDPRAYAELRIPGGVVEQFSFEAESEPAEGEDASNGTAVTDAAPASNGAQAGPDPNQLYDRVDRSTAGGSIYGYVRNENKYALHGKAVNETIVLDMVDLRSGKISVNGMKLEPDEVSTIHLADNLPNRIELRRLALPSGPSSLPARRKFIKDLVRDARDQPWMYELAEKQAEEYIRISDQSVDGYRLKALVLREQGALAEEWRLFHELPESLQDSALMHYALGNFLARLDLDLDAEEQFRAGVEQDGSDAVGRHAFALFLLEAGRLEEAYDEVKAALRYIATLPDDRQRFEVYATLLRVQLALGKTDETSSTLSSLPTGEAFAARRDLLKGAAEYASGQPADARPLLESAALAGAGGAASLGRGCCLLLEGDWAGAERQLQQVIADEPMLRYRANGALGLLYERTGNVHLALPALEAAVVADPEDPYAFYLLGRGRRLIGQYEGAVEALTRSLELSDELVEALGELAATYFTMAERSGDESAEYLYRARRYVDRLVELDSRRAGGPEITYLELQGVIRFRAADIKGAREAFLAGSERSLFCRIGDALVEYAQNHVDEAHGRLMQIQDELRSDDPMRDYVGNALALIEDHSSKEQLRDTFDRNQLGDNWQEQRNGVVGPKIEGGAVHVRGTLRDSGRLVFARAVQPIAGNFISAEVTVTVAPDDQSRFAGLQLELPKRSGVGVSDFRVRLGFRERRPYLLIEDGEVSRARDDEDRKRWDPVEFAGLTGGGATQVRLEVVPREGERQLTLRAIWDGELIHERPIERLNATSRGEMILSLMVDGRGQSKVDATFDDFRLVRRKEK